MPSRSLALLFALSLSACAAHEGPSTADDPPPPRAAITAAVASVQLIRNCDDPASEAASPAPASQSAQAIPPAQPRTLGADVDLFSRSYLLEVRLSVDGADQTVRSAEFVRQPEHIIVT